MDNINAPHWWCDTCDPYETGALSGKLYLLDSYINALGHVEIFCSGRKSDYKKIIKLMSQAKGLPNRVGETQAQNFFNK